ncbi:hypothetical protein BDF20DRAFT_481260 [Mycotypha africana]|uniref:uncharacterized protein n=1 Tax=Mycotypha africana TaxID=64632 RepID=UPI00230030CA|nr:uncharacterized protein BDF20DRAFT_481260 [Mycotypha africana]KAI8979134.1 hypothetical protein BDF20DRAFT_481260 [Mycotypha africana]
MKCLDMEKRINHRRNVFISMLFIVLQSAQLVKASLFSTSDVYISSNPVMLYSNGTIREYQFSVLVAKDFKSGIVPFDNLTQPSASGLEGVLYDRGYSCQLNVSSILPLSNSNSNIPAPRLITGSSKIALVKKRRRLQFLPKSFLFRTGWCSRRYHIRRRTISR